MPELGLVRLVRERADVARVVAVCGGVGCVVLCFLFVGGLVVIV